MPPAESEEWSTGEIVRTLKRIEAAQTATNTRLDILASGFVARAEWEQRKEHIDEKLEALARDVASRRWHPSTIAALVISAATLVILLLRLPL